MAKVTKKQAIIASKKFKSRRTTKPRLERLVQDLNCHPAFVEVLCDALLFYSETALIQSRGGTEQQICTFLFRKFDDLR